MLSEIFWTMVVTGAVATVGLLFRMMYKSKCKTIECCCFKVVRDVDLEAKDMETTDEQQTHIV